MGQMDLSGPLLKLFSLIAGGGRYDVVSVAISFFAVFVIIFIVFPVHECAHGYMARFLGDNSLELEERLTLNPLAHIDPVGAAIMLIFPIGWAKPVVTYPSRCTKVKARTASALIAAAGPASNLIIGYVFIIVYKIFAYMAMRQDKAAMGYVAVAFNYIAFINIFLAVLNLIPIPQFDGFKILMLFIKPRTAYAILERQQIISMIFLMLFFTGLISGVLSFISGGVFSVLYFLSGFIDLFMKI